MKSARLIASAVALASFLLCPTLSAQCCKEKAKALTVASAEAKGTKLFNEVCPITGNPTSAATPVVAYSVEKTDYLVSLCCVGCTGLFAKLDSNKKSEFVARYTGKNRRTAFAKTAKTTKVATAACSDCDKSAEKCADCTMAPAKVTAKTTGKPSAKMDCCAEKAKAAATKDCCDEMAKTAAKKDCCDEKAKTTGKPSAKMDCCDEKAKTGKPSAKMDCCDEKAKAAATKDCCDEKAKAAAKKDCCDEKAKTAAKKDCCAEKAKSVVKAVVK